MQYIGSNEKLIIYEYRNIQKKGNSFQIKLIVFYEVLISLYVLMYYLYSCLV